VRPTSLAGGSSPEATFGGRAISGPSARVCAPTHRCSIEHRFAMMAIMHAVDTELQGRSRGG